MEQLTDVILEFNAFLRDGKGAVTPLSVRIRHPTLGEEGLSHSCIVEFPFERRKPFRISGVDAQQACILSSDFIRSMLEGREYTVIDRDGSPVPVPDVPASFAYNVQGFGQARRRSARRK
ncbi:MAG: hypothetical protein WD767_12990 [Alphaproteobacteria bacterium]